MPIPIQLPHFRLPAGHLPVLDQLRGLACFLVLLNHSFGMLKLPNYLGGQVGTDIFLVISGFSLALRAPEQGTWEFVRRRFLRIFPEYWAALGFFIFLAYWVHDSIPELDKVALHIFALHGFADDVTCFYWAESFWFIGLIVPLYLVFLALRRWIDRLDVLICAAGVGAALMCFYCISMHHRAVLSHIPMRIPMFFLGIAAGRLAAGKTLRFNFSPWLVLGGYGFYHAICQLGEPFSSGLPALGLICAWFGLSHLCSRVAVGRWFVSSVAFLGTVSYEVFLFHQPLMRDYNPSFQIHVLGNREISRPEMLAGMLTALFLICLCAHLFKQAKLRRRVRANQHAPGNTTPLFA